MGKKNSVRQLTRKHGVKVGGAGGEYDAMSEDFLVCDDEDDVAKFAMLP